MAVFDSNALEKSSGTIGYELINDRRRINQMRSPNRRSTPDSGRYLRSQEAASRERQQQMQQKHQEEISSTPIHPIVQRVIKKRTKQSLVRRVIFYFLNFLFDFLNFMFKIKMSDSMASSRNDPQMTNPFKV